MNSVFSTAVSITIALVIALVASENAGAQSATTTPKDAQNRCSIDGGVSKNDLLRLAQTGDNIKWVQWYIGNTNSLEEALKPIKPENFRAKIQKTANCESIEKFKVVINNFVHDAPELVCSGGDYDYRFKAIGNHMEMEIVLKKPIIKIMSREFVTATTPHGANAGCKIKLSQEKPDSKAFKLCLSANAFNANSQGTLAMTTKSGPLPENARNVACRAEEGFKDNAQALVKAEAGAPATSSPALARANK